MCVRFCEGLSAETMSSGPLLVSSPLRHTHPPVDKMQTKREDHVFCIHQRHSDQSIARLRWRHIPSMPPAGRRAKTRIRPNEVEAKSADFVCLMCGSAGGGWNACRRDASAQAGARLQLQQSTTTDGYWGCCGQCPLLGGNTWFRNIAAGFCTRRGGRRFFGPQNWNSISRLFASTRAGFMKEPKPRFSKNIE